MIDSTSNKPYSAKVELTLHTGEKEYQLAKVGLRRVFLRTAVDLPPCDATLTINIDGHITTKNIRLPEGASANCASVVTAE